MGHPAPFNLKMIGIGNEQWGPQYIERYAMFANALKSRHPEITLIAASGPEPSDERFKFCCEKMRELKADIIDEHCYAVPDWFFTNANRYDNYDRSGPKVFMGEYAAQSDKPVSVANRNNLECALAEAAYLTGMERNADVVHMTAYAPLFAHIDAWQWRPNLIWTDNLRIMGTPNYYVQQMFSCNAGDVVLPTRLDGVEESASGRRNLYANATFDEKTGEVILKAVNPTSEPIEVEIELEGAKDLAAFAQITVLTSEKLSDENSLDDPRKVYPVSNRIRIPGARFRHAFPPHSLTVLRCKR
jgi:alpha-L-arabinofuranosidase